MNRFCIKLITDRLSIVLVILYCTTSISSLIVQNNNNFGVGSLKAVPKRVLPGSEPLLLRTARGEEVERIPVWMMRQAGRHMKV
jgi:uroporphyrinogen decarboxylase